MQAIILAGGMGTRLRPLTQELPKPMIPVLNKPLMEYSIDLLKKHNIKDVGVTLMFLPQYIKNYFGNGDENFKISYYTENDPLGTAGCVKLAENELDDTFIVISGDALTNIDITKILKYHRSINADVTMVLSKQDNPLEYGVVLTDTSGKVVSFHEKPQWENVVTNTVNTGIYVVEKKILNKIPQNTFFDFSKDLFPLLLRENYRLFGYITEDYWCDLGNPEAYLKASSDILSGKFYSQKYENVLSENVVVSENTKLVPPVYIGKNSIINGNSIIGPNVVIGENCIIENSEIEDSVLWDKVLINESNFSKTIIGNNSSLFKNILGGNNVIGSNVKLNKNVHVLNGISIENNMNAPENSTIDGINNFNLKKESLWTDCGISGIWDHDINHLHLLGIASSFKAEKIIICSNKTSLATALCDLLASYYSLCGTNAYISTANEASCRFFACINKIKAVYIYEKNEKILIQLIDEKGLNISHSAEKNIKFSSKSFSLNRGRIIKLNSIDKDFEYYLNATIPFSKENVQISSEEKYRLHNLLWENEDFNGQIKKIAKAALKAENGSITDLFDEKGRVSSVAYLRLKCSIASFLGSKKIFLPVYTPEEILFDAKNSGLTVLKLKQHRGDSMQQAESFTDPAVLLEFVPAFFAQALAFYLSQNSMPDNDKIILTKFDFSSTPLNTCKTIFALNKNRTGEIVSANYKNGLITIVPQNNGYFFSAYGKFLKEEYAPDILEEFINDNTRDL